MSRCFDRREHDMKRNLTILILFSFGILSAQTFSMDDMDVQDTIVAGFHMEGYFDWGIPIRDFGEGMYQNGVGGGFQLLYNVQGPIWLGLGMHTFRFDKFKISYYEYDGRDRYEIKEVTASRAMLAGTGTTQIPSLRTKNSTRR